MMIDPTCPYCNVTHECATGLGEADGETPGDGCYIICIGCGKVSIVENGKLRKPNQDEKATITTDRTILEAQLFIAARG